VEGERGKKAERGGLRLRGERQYRVERERERVRGDRGSIGFESERTEGERGRDWRTRNGR
jgi:hypothetical protein